MIETIQAFADYAKSHESLLAVDLQRVRGRSKSTEMQTLLRGIKLVIEKPEIIVVWGRSGVGKSTFLKAISGADPEQQFQGDVHLKGELVRSTGSKKLAPEIVYMAQEPIFSSRNLEVKHLLNAACITEDSRMNILRVLDALQLPEEVLEASPHDLSGGQRQRVQIARAVLREPKVLILDEPSNALDSIAKKGLAETILNIKKQVQGALIIATHDIELTRAVADSILVMGDNWQQEDGSPGSNNIFIDTSFEKIKGIDPSRLIAKPNDPKYPPVNWEEVQSLMNSPYSILPGSLEPRAA